MLKRLRRYLKKFRKRYILCKNDFELEAIAMKIPYKYAPKELRELLNSLVILIDTREQKNGHIIRYLNNKGIKHKSKKLDYGDYSFILPANKKLGIQRDIYFNNDIVIERKASLEELSGCFTQERARFENELIRASNGKMILLVEKAKGYQDNIEHNYRTDYQPRSFIGTLHSFRHRYNMEVIFADPAYSGNFIYYTFYYWLRECLK